MQTETPGTEALRAVTGEPADFLAALAKHRGFLCHAVVGLTDEQAALRPTASELCLGGIVRHVALMEERWVTFMLEGPAAIGAADEAAYQAHAASFLMGDSTLNKLLTRYEEVARRTADVVASLPSLDDEQALPEAPWFEPGARWSARRTLLHILAETSQHAGHADIIRETIDGAKTMG